jgi:hypothetical protein
VPRFDPARAVEGELGEGRAVVRGDRIEEEADVVAEAPAISTSARVVAMNIG